MENRDNETNPLEILFYCLGIAIIVIPIGIALRLVIPEIGTAIGLAGAILGGGITATSTVATWVIPVAAAGLGISGGTVGVVLLERIVREAGKKPFHWLAPVFAVFGGFMTDLSIELYPLPGIPKVACGAATAAALVGGSLLWQRPGIISKLLGAVLFLFPPVFLLFNSVKDHLSEGIYAVAKVAPITWLSIGLLFVILISIVLLSYTTREDRK